VRRRFEIPHWPQRHRQPDLLLQEAHEPVQSQGEAQQKIQRVLAQGLIPMPDCFLSVRGHAVEVVNNDVTSNTATNVNLAISTLNKHRDK
jgi:hypothetical protein